MKTIYYKNDNELRQLMGKYFVHYLPKYLDETMKREYSHEIQQLANLMDYFEFHFRHYVSGTHLTLHRVLYETRRLFAMKYFEPETATNILAVIETDILSNELYELMPRFLKAKKRVIKEMVLIP